MSKLVALVHNVETNEISEREFTDEEIAIVEQAKLDKAVKEAEAETKAQAKAELLDRLGITEDEAKLLLS